MCKYFLEAIEGNKYGWFWVCPAGGDSCMYRHALPPGFVLKKDKKKEEKEDEISLEELIENEVRMEGGKILTWLLACIRFSEAACIVSLICIDTFPHPHLTMCSPLSFTVVCVFAVTGHSV